MSLDLLLLLELLVDLEKLLLFLLQFDGWYYTPWTVTFVSTFCFALDVLTTWFALWFSFSPFVRFFTRKIALIPVCSCLVSLRPTRCCYFLDWSCLMGCGRFMFGRMMTLCFSSSSLRLLATGLLQARSRLCFLCLTFVPVVPKSKFPASSSFGCRGWWGGSIDVYDNIYDYWMTMGHRSAVRETWLTKKSTSLMSSVSGMFGM